MTCDKCKKELTEKEAVAFKLVKADWGICDKCLDKWVDRCFEMDFSMPTYGQSGVYSKAKRETWAEKQLRIANRREAA